MKKTDLAYIAGIVDGEGTVGIARMRRKESKSWTYTLRVSVQMSAEFIARWLQFSFGGRVYPRRWSGQNWKAQYQWVISGEEAGGFLKAILPYLRLKRAQAELVFRFMEIKGKGQRANAFERYIQELHYQEIKKLNRRGVNGRENKSDVSSMRDDAVSGESGEDG